MVATNSVQGEVLIPVGDRQLQRGRGPSCVPIVFDDDPADTSRCQRVPIGPGQQQLLHLAGARALAGHDAAADRQVASRQYVGAHPAREWVECRGIAGPREAAHAVDGSTATGRGSALIIADTFAHPGGYWTADTLPPTPQARSGNVAINAAQQISAVAAAGIR